MLPHRRHQIIDNNPVDFLAVQDASDTSINVLLYSANNPNRLHDFM